MAQIARAARLAMATVTSRGGLRASAVDRVNLKDVLGQIEADGRDLHRGGSKLVLRDSTTLALRRREWEPSTPSAFENSVEHCVWRRRGQSGPRRSTISDPQLTLGTFASARMR